MIRRKRFYLADRSGHAIKIPYVFNQLNRKLARWAFRACTSADLKLPSFALTDDGVLIEHRGKILSASDWIPEDSAITSLAAEKGLCIRYPIRMQEDLLPVRHLTESELVPALKQALGTDDLGEAEIAYLLDAPASDGGHLHPALEDCEQRTAATSISTPSASCHPISSRSS